MPRHPEHLQAFDYVGPHRYSLRFCTESRRPIFTDAPAVELVLKHFLQEAGEQGFAILAYYLKQQYTRKLWQRYGYERVIRDDEATTYVARYILANPLRAGLVKDIREYRFTGSSVVTIGELIEHLRRM